MRNAMKFREKLQRGHVCFGVGITFYDPTVTDATLVLGHLEDGAQCSDGGGGSGAYHGNAGDGYHSHCARSFA